jgi:RimJ/RimL family protein N-acetyltransferase
MRSERTPTELKQSDFGAGLGLLEHFPNDVCNLQALLKDAQSRLFVDDGAAPRVALLCSADGKGISFIGGDPTQAPRLFEFILTSAEHPPQLQFISLPYDSWRHPTPSYPEAYFFELQRVVFSLEDFGKFQGWQNRVRNNLSMQRIDESLSKQIRDGWSQWFPRVKPFTSQDIGYCLVHDGSVVSLAYGSPVSGSVEIVIETHKEFQGQGLAPLCCAAFIEECLQNSIQPVWSAGANHTQSVSVAKKLGFGNERFYWWLVRHK